MDLGKIVKLGGHFQGTIECRTIIEDQFTKDLIDAIELLETRRTVQKRECIFADIKELANPLQVRSLALEETQVGCLSTHLEQISDPIFVKQP
jgi:hypothetical protein